MARPLRIERPGARYHVTARGNERRPIYRDETDRAHFVSLLPEMGERFGARVHAYVLMDNHFHLLLETPEGNLSRTMQWLNVSYSVWFNRRHDHEGHLFQGRLSPPGHHAPFRLAPLAVRVPHRLVLKSKIKTQES